MPQSRLEKTLEQNLEFINTSSLISLDFVNLQMDNIIKLIDNKSFMKEIQNAISVILDQNKDGQFDSVDIKLLNEIFTNKKNQIGNITNFCLKLLNIVISIISKYDKFMLKLDKDALEGIFFGILIYVLFQYSGNDKNTQKDIIGIIIVIYTTIQTLDNTFKISKKILDLFKKKCVCCKNDVKAIKKVNENINKKKLLLNDETKKAKETAKLYNTIEILKNRLEILENN